STGTSTGTIQAFRRAVAGTSASRLRSTTEDRFALLSVGRVNGSGMVVSSIKKRKPAAKQTGFRLTHNIQHIA
ncbi:MAG TPA: hypothetical protein PLK75_09270, partial [Bacteroidales bacterium]|nr:hypothetical protein [Bacteroidales bacterium]